MQLGTVIGHATSTIKHESFIGKRLLIVQMLNVARLPEADPVIAIDNIGSGVGSTVILSSDGKGARAAIGNAKSPVRWFVLAVADDGQKGDGSQKSDGARKAEDAKKVEEGRKTDGGKKAKGGKKS